MQIKKLKRKTFSGFQITFSSPREAQILVAVVMEALKSGDCEVELGGYKVKVPVEGQGETVGLYSGSVGSA